MKRYEKNIDTPSEEREETHRTGWVEIKEAMDGLPVIGREMAWPGDTPGKDGGQVYEFDTGYVCITSEIYGPEHFTEEAGKTSSVVFKANLYGLGIQSESEFGKRVQKVFEEDLGFEPQN